MPPHTSTIMNTWSRGELSPYLNGRTDVQTYFNGAKTIENFFVLPYGGLKRRSGTYYAATTKDSDKVTRVIPFQFSTTQSYIIEIGDAYMRFYRNQGQITQTIETFTHFKLNDDAANTTVTDDGSDGNDGTSSDNTEDMTTTGKINAALAFDGSQSVEMNASAVSIKDDTTGTIAFWVSSAALTGFVFALNVSSEDTGIYVNVNASGNISFTVTDAGSTKLAATGDTVMVVDTFYHIAIVQDGTELKMYVNSVLQTLTFSVSTDKGAWFGTTTSDVDRGRLACYVNGSDTEAGFAECTIDDFRYYQAKVFSIEQVKVLYNLGNGTESDAIAGAYELVSPYAEDDIFDLQFVQDADTMYIVHPTYKPRKLTRTGHAAWSISNYAPTADPFTSENNYPSCVAIYEQRLIFANTNNDPQKIFTTKSGDYEDMTTGSDDDHGMVYTLGSEQVNAIRWLSSGKILLLGTLGAVFSLSSGTNQDPLTPSNVIVKRESSFGSIGVLPRRIGNFVYYVQRNKKVIREIGYSLEFDEYQAADITVLSEHITGDGIVDMDYQQGPYNMLWCVREDGEMAVLTRQIEQEVLGWSRIFTDGEFESVAIIPGDSSDDEVWVVVRRLINGNYVRYIEYFKPTVIDDQEDGYFVDCGLTLDSPITISGITNANPAVVTATSHGLSDGDTITIRNVVGVEDSDEVDTLAAGLNGSKFKVANKTTHTFEITDTDDTDIDSTEYGVYLSGGEARKCVTSVIGLDHLEGESVAVCGDGAVLSSETVTNGAITIDTSSGEIHAGLPFTSKLQTMRLEAGQQSGTSQGKLKKISKAIVRLHETVGCNIGDDVSQDAITFRTTDDETDEAIPLFTGDKIISFSGTFDREAYAVVTQEQPLPLNILAIVLFFVTNEP